MLEFRDSAVRRDGQVRLGPIQLALETRGLTVIVGHNGAGKSLLLRLAHGLIAPSAGAVTWGGKPVDQTRAVRGFVFQTTPLMRRSVEANLAFPLVAHGWRAPARRQAVDTMLEEVGLTAQARNPAATLSGGERQRLAVGRALITRPDAVLLDEPSANLDPAATMWLERMIAAIRGRGVGVIMSSHDLRQAERLGGDVLLLEAGRVALHLPSEAFFAEDAPAPAMAFRRGDFAG